MLNALVSNPQCLIAAVSTMQVIEGKATLTQLVRNWSISFAGNLLGSVGLVYLVSVSGLLTPLPGPAKMAAAKTSLSFIQVRTSSCQ